MDCVLAPGGYLVELTVPQAVRITRNLRVRGRELEARFELGHVEAGTGKMLQLGRGRSVRRATFEAGPRRITITDDEGARTVNVVVKPGATVVAD
ncbi:hypothetical protein D3C83_89110 [compost metagenome]